MVKKGVGEAFRCWDHREGVVGVQTPLRFPDNDLIGVFVESRGDGFRVSDFGKAHDWLWIKKGGRDLTEKESDKIRTICSGLELRLSDGVISDIADADALGRSVLRVGECMLRIADLSMRFRERSTPGFRKEVERAFEKWNLTYSTRFRVRIESGDSRQVDYKITPPSSPDSPRLVQTLSASSMSRAKQKADRVFSTWVAFDEFTDYSPDDCVSLVDDLELNWPPSRLQMLEDHSRVGMWSDTAGVRRALSGEAAA